MNNTDNFSSRRVIKHDIEAIRSLFKYDPLTGIVSRIHESGRPRAKDGKPNTAGYLVISVDKKLYHCHLIAWALSYGGLPDDSLIIDHKNRNKIDNRLTNLRLRTQRLNCLNATQQKGTQTGLRGVYPSGKKFMAKIRDVDRLLHLGSFMTAELASEVYEVAHKTLVDRLEAELAEKLKAINELQ